MAEESQIEFLWFLEMARPLFERYPLRWIAINGGSLRQNNRSIESVVVADGATLGEAAAIARGDFDPLSLFYAFVDPPLGRIERRSRDSFA